jgi:hypothetical protein
VICQNNTRIQQKIHLKIQTIEIYLQMAKARRQTHMAASAFHCPVVRQGCPLEPGDRRARTGGRTVWKLCWSSSQAIERQCTWSTPSRELWSSYPTTSPSPTSAPLCSCCKSEWSVSVIAWLRLGVVFVSEQKILSEKLWSSPTMISFIWIEIA